MTSPGMSGSGVIDPGSAAAPTPGRSPRGGPPPLLFLVAAGSLLVGAILIAAQVLGIGVAGPGASATIPPTGQAATRTHDQVVTVLERASFQVRDPQTAYRPGESPELVNAPRRLVQAVLPNDPQGGYVVIYELPTNGDADRVGREFAAYLASGTGAIQYPRDAQFVLRRVGPTLVFFAWSPEVSPDPRVADMAAALETIGTPITP